MTMFKRIGVILLVAIGGASALSSASNSGFPACMGSFLVPRP